MATSNVTFGTLGSFSGLLTSCLGINTNVVCLAYSWYYLRISSHVKVILYAMASHNIAAFSAMAASQVWALSDVRVGRSKCLLQTLPLDLAYLGSYVFTANIATIRYYMTSRTANSHRINYTFLKSLEKVFLGFVVLFDAAYIALSFTTNWIEDSFTTQICMGLPGAHSIGGNIITILAAIAIIASFGYDLALVVVIKKQSRVAPMRLVVWTTPMEPRADQGESKDTIPLKSSILSTLSLIVLASVNGFAQKVLPFDYIPLASALVLLTFMPLILTLSVQSQENRSRSRPRPPSDLQFHE